MVAKLRRQRASGNALSGELRRRRRVDTRHPSGGFEAKCAALRSPLHVTATSHRLFATRPGSGVLLDAAIAAVVLAGSLALIAHGGVPGWVADDPAGIGRHRAELASLDWLAVLLAVCASASLLAWRRSPIGVFAFIGAATALLVGLGYTLWLPLGASVALFLLAASRDEDDPWTRRTTSTVLVVFGAYLLAAGVDDDGVPGAELLHGGLAFAVAWFAGERTRLRREHIAELKERAARAERDAERERRLAVAEERARIARDLHDAAGHAINVITVRAGAARTRNDPERSQAALAVIEELARQTAAEIDAIVGTLRDPGVSNGTAPLGLASLDTLVAGHTATGLDVSVTHRGTPRPLEGPTDQAAYRILQEALTNAARHGTGPARIELAFADTALELTVCNRAIGEDAVRSNGGHGLTGMRERAGLLGGTFDAERANGDFRVRARLPYRGPQT
jgi:signal transduction histidine kinase